jgi:hypothetical protein
MLRTEFEVKRSIFLDSTMRDLIPYLSLLCLLPAALQAQEHSGNDILTGACN